jgi:hypothetical protein
MQQKSISGQLFLSRWNQEIIVNLQLDTLPFAAIMWHEMVEIELSFSYISMGSFTFAERDPCRVVEVPRKARSA